MNIASVNLVSGSPGSKAIESGSQCMPTDTADSADFTKTLAALKKPVEGLKPQAKQPGEPVTVESPIDNSLKSSDEQKDLVALLEKYLPLAPNAEKETDPADPEAPMADLTAGQPPATMNVPAQPPVQEVTIKQDPDAITDTTLSQDMNLLLNSIPPPPLNPTTSECTPNAIKSLPEKAQLTVSGENKTTDAKLQKDSVFSLPNKDIVETDTQSGSVDPSKSVEKPLVSLADSTGSQKTAPDAVTETFSIPKTTDHKVELPALTKPLNHPGWSKDLGAHIVWMNNKDISVAEIKLNPLNLGPISIRIDVGQDNQASIQFTAQHMEVKEALEASIPKLREMLNSQQVNLVNVNISQNPGSNHGRQANQPFHSESGSQKPNLEAGTNPLEHIEPEQIISKGLLSLYA